MPKGGVRENASRTPTAQPWKTDANLRRFTVKQQERRQAAQALAERNSQSGFNVNPDYRTVHTDAFGPSTSGVIKKERCVPRAPPLFIRQSTACAARRGLSARGGRGEVRQLTQSWGRTWSSAALHTRALSRCAPWLNGQARALNGADRAKKLAALDECVTKDWTTTQDNYGNYHQCVRTPAARLSPQHPVIPLAGRQLTPLMGWVVVRQAGFGAVGGKEPVGS